MKLKCCKNKESISELKKDIDFLKIISEHNRLKILCILREDEQCVCEIWECLKLPQNLTSHHLKVLKNFGLISSKKEGLRVYYKINKKVLEKYLKSLNRFINPK